MVAVASGIRWRCWSWPRGHPVGPLTTVIERARARRMASERIRKALRIVDLPELLGPTRMLKRSSARAKSRNALYRENRTDVMRCVSVGRFVRGWEDRTVGLYCGVP